MKDGITKIAHLRGAKRSADMQGSSIILVLHAQPEMKTAHLLVRQVDIALTAGVWELQ
jgi:hypothetical protein